MTAIQSKIRAIDAANIRCAEIILREAAKQGDDSGLSVEWARQVLAKAGISPASLCRTELPQ